MDSAELTNLALTVAVVDVDDLGPRPAEELVAAAAQLSHAAAALAARAARRAGQTEAHRRCGDRTEAHHLARVSGLGLGAAKTALEVVASADELAATGAAFRRGDLSVRQAAAICGAALVDRRAEPRLLRLAKARGIGQLEDECARIRAAAAPDDEAERHRNARSARGAWRHQHRDGSAEIRFRSSADDVAEIWATVSAYRERLFRAGQGGSGGERATFDQRSADAVLDMARAAAGRSGVAQPELPLDGIEPARPAANVKKIVVRVDLAALLRGYPAEGEVCEIPGYGPIPVAAVTDMLATGNPFLAAVVTKGTDVATVAHLGRDPTAHQRTALEWLNPRCRAEGCDRTIGLELDHRIDWAATEVTLLDWLEWMCTHHHDLKTHHGWRLVQGTGIRPFVPPDDPRHPDHARTV
jgi:hypothetical protein